jgi:hypothetical protein
MMISWQPSPHPNPPPPGGRELIGTFAIGSPNKVLCFETFILGISALPVIARNAVTKQSYGLSNGYGIASSAFGLLAMTNGEFFKGLDV